VLEASVPDGLVTGILDIAPRPAHRQPSVGLTAAMLRYARDRLLAVLADAGRLPVRDGCLSAVITVMVHTDMPAYAQVMREAVRVLRPGGVFVHIGVHPCLRRVRGPQ